MRILACFLGLLLASLVLVQGGSPSGTALRFEITVARGLLDAPRDGRVLVFLGRGKGGQPRPGRRDRNRCDPEDGR